MTAKEAKELTDETIEPIRTETINWITSYVKKATTKALYWCRVYPNDNGITVERIHSAAEDLGYSSRISLHHTRKCVVLWWNSINEIIMSEKCECGCETTFGNFCCRDCTEIIPVCADCYMIRESCGCGTCIEGEIFHEDDQD